MNTNRRFPRTIVIALVAGLVAASALAETAAEKLDKAGELFKTKQYDQARKTLQAAEAAQLNADQQRRREELGHEVDMALSEANKIERNLQNAEQALEAHDRLRAAAGFAAVQANKYATDDQIARARKGVATVKKQFDAAREQLAAARRIVEAARRDFAPEKYGELERNLAALARFIDEEERTCQPANTAQRQEKARREQEEWRKRDDVVRQERVQQLFVQVSQLKKERQFAKVADVLRQILVIDPTCERAQFLLEAVEDVELIRVGELVKRTQEPHVCGKMIVYPDPSDEQRVIVKRDPSAAAEAEAENDRRTRERLRTKAPVIEKPEGASFEEALNWIREQATVSFNVNWNALSTLAIERSTDTLGISLQNVRYETILRLLLDKVGGPERKIDYDIVDGVIRISTADDLNRTRAR